MKKYEKIMSEEEFIQHKEEIDKKLTEEKESVLEDLTASIEEEKEDKPKSKTSFEDFISTDDIETKEEDEKVEKVVVVEDGAKQANKGRKVIKVVGITALCVAILCGVGAASYYGFNMLKHKNKNKTSGKIESGVDEIDITPVVDEIDIKTVSENDTVSDNTIEIEEKVIDVNSDEYIKEIADKAWNIILDERNNNNSFAPSMDQEYVEDLVRYVHHDEADYKGTYNITNDNAYGNFFDLDENDKVIGTLFEGLDSEEYMKNLNSKIVNTVDNGDYKEEYEAFAAIEDAIDNVDLENVPERYAMMALLDKHIGIGQDMEAMILDNKYEILTLINGKCYMKT